MELQFSLLPIRDWNFNPISEAIDIGHCNFHYSLLGIETGKVHPLLKKNYIAIFITPY